MGMIAGTILSLFIPKIKTGISMRKKRKLTYPWMDMPADQNPIWFHCASGELEYAKPVLKKLKQTKPELVILLTYFSPSVKKSAEACPYVDIAVPLPWDHVTFFRDFLKHHKPRALLIARTDLWPEMLYTTHKFNIPTLLFSCTFSEEKSRLKNFLFRKHTEWILSFLDGIYCVSSSDKKNLEFLTLPSKNIVAGDTRYDQVIERLHNPNSLNGEIKPSGSVFVAGSTWEPDEKIIMESFKEILNLGIRIIIAPHEPTEKHLKQLEKQFDILGLSHQRYTKSKTWKAQNVLVVDRVGILADLYSWACYAFVGNSFQKHAVHSVMEPLAAGCVTFVGPYHKNNPEALEFKQLKSKGFHFVNAISNSSHLVQTLKSLEETNVSEFKDCIMEEVSKRTGASEKVVQWIIQKI